ncbi:hypothetical protein [Nocardia tengchongensis]|uniref:hypothetical protein n=1 Tax=Nocardia tengchongensis TaxID=2055889 RepID=UPI00367CDC70
MGSNDRRRVWYLHPDGYAIDNDELVQTARGWVLPTPILCSGPQRHVLRANRSTLGWTACQRPGCSRGHLVHTCGRCGAHVYQPELGPGCSPLAFDGRDGVGNGI